MRSFNHIQDWVDFKVLLHLGQFFRSEFVNKVPNIPVQVLPSSPTFEEIGLHEL